MGEKRIQVIDNSEDRKQFIQHLLNDVKALEYMLENDMIERYKKRIGAEQELIFVDQAWRPVPIGPQILELSNQDCFTSEYAQFNLEINSEPLLLRGKCLSSMKKKLSKQLEEVSEIAERLNAKIALCGILPTISAADVKINSLTPEPRYRAILKVTQEARGKQYEYHIKGIDELITRQNPNIYGGTMTSFQIHLQVDPEEIIDKYNWSMAISGPLLASAGFSPLFMGKRLWRETRIALFRQTTDTRKPYDNFKEEDARVTFGADWAHDSIMEVFKEDIAQYKSYLTTDLKEDASEMVRKGKIPDLQALSLHNGTIYKWNRLCYGVYKGKPHLRIENRILPAGPTLEDELANTAFWVGLMEGMPKKYQDIQDKLEFSDAKDNFLKAARLGLEVQFKWFEDKIIPAQKLILKELIPIARKGLKACKVDNADIKHYLGIIRERVKKGKTGAQWMLDSHNKMMKDFTKDETMVSITAAMVNNQKKDIPVHKWPLAERKQANGWSKNLSRLDQIMSSTLYTVNDDDVVDLAAHIMNWKKIGHVPVENEKGKLVGLITKDTLINFLVEHMDIDIKTLPIKEVMLKDLIVGTPDMSLQEAMHIMLESNLSCLPVCKKGILVGIVTEHDFVEISKYLYEELDQKRQVKTVNSNG